MLLEIKQLIHNAHVSQLAWQTTTLNSYVDMLMHHDIKDVEKVYSHAEYVQQICSTSQNFASTAAIQFHRDEQLQFSFILTSSH